MKYPDKDYSRKAVFFESLSLAYFRYCCFSLQITIIYPKTSSRDFSISNEKMKINSLVLFLANVALFPVDSFTL